VYLAHVMLSEAPTLAAKSEDTDALFAAAFSYFLVTSHEDRFSSVTPMDALEIRLTGFVYGSPFVRQGLPMADTDPLNVNLRIVGETPFSFSLSSLLCFPSLFFLSPFVFPFFLFPSLFAFPLFFSFFSLFFFSPPFLLPLFFPLSFLILFFPHLLFLLLLPV